MEEGVVGFGKGIFKGAIGVVMKPASGTTSCLYLLYPPLRQALILFFSRST